MRTIVNTELHQIGGGMAASEPQEFLPPPPEQPPVAGTTNANANDPGAADLYWQTRQPKAR